MKEESIVFGRKPVQELLLHAPERVLKIVLEDKLQVDSLPDPLRKLLSENRKLLRAIKRDALEEIAPGHHQGIAAYVHAKPESSLEDIIMRVTREEAGIILILDEITDPQNLGGILRAAEAFGVSGVILTKRRSAGMTAVVQRVSAGASELLDVCTVGNLQRAIESLKKSGIWVYGTALEESSVPLQNVKFAFPAALILGSEGEGMRQLTKKLCDQLVEIPLPGRMQSLNVNQAGAVLLYELRRQSRR